MKEQNSGLVGRPLKEQIEEFLTLHEEKLLRLEARAALRLFQTKVQNHNAISEEEIDKILKFGKLSKLYE